MAKAQARNTNEEKNNPNAFKAASKNAGVAAWKKARTEAPREIGQKIPKGRYTAKLTKMVCGDQDFEMEIGKGKKQKIKIPLVRFNFLITSGEYKGANVSKFINLRPESVQYSEYDYADLSESLQKLGYQIDDADLSGIPDIAEDATKEQPEVMIYCDIKEYTNKKGEKKEIQVVRVNELIKDAPPSDDSGEEEADDSEEVDLDALATSADDDSDEEAQTKLTEIAEKYDIDPNNLDTWADVAEAIKEAQEGAAEEEAEEEEAEEEADEVVSVKPVKKKVAKQPVKKPLKKGRK